MADHTLVGRCLVAYIDAFEEAITSAAVAPNSRRAGIRAVIEHLAAELTVTGHHDAARCLLSQLQAQGIPLRPHEPDGVA